MFFFHLNKALRVIKVRAESMQKASEMQPSGLMTVFLNKESKLKKNIIINNMSVKWEVLKDKANEEVKKQNYTVAVSLYTDSISKYN